MYLSFYFREKLRPLYLSFPLSTFPREDPVKEGPFQERSQNPFQERSLLHNNPRQPTHKMDTQIRYNNASKNSSDEESEEFSGGEDSSDEEDDTADTVATYIGYAIAPAGYKVLHDCPPLETDKKKAKFIGKTVLTGWDSKAADSWFRGTVHSIGPFTKSDLKRAPSANLVVKYIAKDTQKKLNGTVACELSLRTHGVSQWWVQLEAVA